MSDITFFVYSWCICINVQGVYGMNSNIITYNRKQEKVKNSKQFGANYFSAFAV